jgi:hypothetical protein
MLVELKSAVPIKKGDDILDKFIKGESADIALNVTPTYSRVPEIVRQLKTMYLLLVTLQLFRLKL